ncbi:diguanylate cyclase [Terasakiella brassicae]|uniref:Diguanylate cyclase n=1 Tax=Terasakiella brassicae TaxID=1634917 RepID=A0A917BNV6_9PROT|nr:response regulator [Terasakiella brassicae]GGF53411.1 diguanylate cyclase [Terasakiella brassicae]
MAEILLVEDAKFFRNIIKSQIETKFGYNVTAVETYSEAVEQLTNSNKHFDLGLLDLNLPDAPDGEIVDIVTGMGVPSLIFSGHFSEAVRDMLEHPSVIDYVVKDSPASLNYVLNMVDRYFKNSTCCALVVDDSRVALKHMETLLKRFNFKVLCASKGHEALNVFNENPDIRLIICDYNMPDMQGTELCKLIRAQKNRDQVCIIGVSAYGNQTLSAQFLKAGASDFLVKPFLTEEFFCRITLNMDALEKVHKLDELVHTDLVSQLKNRRFLEEEYERTCQTAETNNLSLACAFFELDDFKAFNESHGNDGGDAILFMMAREFERHFNRTSPLVVRYSGSQFCFLCATDQPNNFVEEMQTLHRHIINRDFRFGKQHLSVDVSGMLCIASPGKYADLLDDTKRTLESQAARKGCFVTA